MHEEPDALIAHVRICGGPARATGRSTRPVATPALPAGAPGATTTIDGRYLPNPTIPFRGDIQTNEPQSKPSWPALITPPKGAPNVLLIMIDDEGFSAPSTFGGVIPTDLPVSICRSL